MVQGVIQWARLVIGSVEDLLAAEQYFRVRLDWDKIRRGAGYGVAELLVAQQLDLLDYCLGYSNDFSDADELQEILDRSGSAWTVGRDDDGRYCLEKRVDKTAEKAAHQEMHIQGNASSYLRSAWHQVYGRNPNPSEAFRNAVRAIEAAARPVVIPNDSRATLGKMICALRNKPEKWQTAIGDVDTLRKMMQTIWKSQFDRHGTDDTSKPINVSQSEAEAAVQMRVTLVQLFRTGAIRRDLNVP